MKPTVLFALAASLLAAACQTTAMNVQSRRPEVIIHNSNVYTLKNALAYAFTDAGFSIGGSNDFQLQLEKHVDSPLASVVYGSQYNTTPDMRLTFSFIQLGADTRVIGDMAIITNPHSAFEDRTELQDSGTLKSIQDTLNKLAEKAGN